jgi:hypothetical protein
MKSLIRLATEDIDLVTEIRDCMRRIPWSLIDAIDESESSWFQPGPGRVENEGHALQAEYRMIPDSQPTSDEGRNSADGGDGSQIPKPSDDEERATPSGLPSRDGEEEEMDHDGRDSNDKQKAPPSGVLCPDDEDQEMDDDRQDSNDREKTPSSGVGSQGVEEGMDKDGRYSNDMQKAPPSGVLCPDGEDQEMDDDRQDSNDREKAPPSVVAPRDGEDQEMRGDTRSRGANDALSRQSSQKYPTPRKRQSSNIDNSEAQPRDPRLRLRKRNDAPPLTPQPSTKKIKVKRPQVQNQTAGSSIAPPLTPEPSTKKIKVKRPQVQNQTAGSSIESPIDVDKLFVSVIDTLSLSLTLTLSPGRAKCHP